MNKKSAEELKKDLDSDNWRIAQRAAFRLEKIRKKTLKDETIIDYADSKINKFDSKYKEVSNICTILFIIFSIIYYTISNIFYWSYACLDGTLVNDFGVYYVQIIVGIVFCVSFWLANRKNIEIGIKTFIRTGGPLIIIILSLLQLPDDLSPVFFPTFNISKLLYTIGIVLFSVMFGILSIPFLKSKGKYFFELMIDNEEKEAKPKKRNYTKLFKNLNWVAVGFIILIITLVPISLKYSFITNENKDLNGNIVHFSFGLESWGWDENYSYASFFKMTLAITVDEERIRVNEIYCLYLNNSAFSLDKNLTIFNESYFQFPLFIANMYYRWDFYIEDTDGYFASSLFRFPVNATFYGKIVYNNSKSNETILVVPKIDF